MCCSEDIFYLALSGLLSGSLWLSGPCSARSVVTALQHFIQPWEDTSRTKKRTIDTEKTIKTVQTMDRVKTMYIGRSMDTGKNMDKGRTTDTRRTMDTGKTIDTMSTKDTGKIMDIGIDTG